MDHHEPPSACLEVSRDPYQGLDLRSHFEHKGRYWHLKVPTPRPRPHTKPHPPLDPRRFGRGVVARIGTPRAGPFLMNVQSMAVTCDRCWTRYREAMREAGLRRRANCSAILQQVLGLAQWSSVLATPMPRLRALAFRRSRRWSKSRAVMRDCIYRETGLRIEVPQSDLPSTRASVEHGFIHGSPETVTEAIGEIAELGIGGVIATFRLGPLPHEAATDSLRYSCARSHLSLAARQRVGKRSPAF